MTFQEVPLSKNQAEDALFVVQDIWSVILVGRRK
jgi:hypothetical protein